MDVDTPLRLSKHLVLESEDSATGDRTIFNNMTGMRAQISPQSMTVLKMMQQPVSTSQLAKKLGISTEADIMSLQEHLVQLFEQTIIIDGCNSDNELRASIELADADLVSAQQVTFVSAPSARLEELEPGAFAICGIGVDFATTAKPGTKLGPAALRQLSGSFLTYERDIFTGKNQGWYNADLGRVLLAGAVIQDVGNVSHKLCEPPERLYTRLGAVMSTILGAGAFPVHIGGDHSLTAPLVETASKRVDDSLVVVQLDAHTDLAEWLPGTTHHHGNMMRRVLQVCPNVELVQLGIRGFAGSLDPDERRQTFTQAMLDADLEAVLSQLPAGKRCYLTIDTDVLDPSFAPGTGTPVPMGMHPRQLLQVTKRLARQNSIVGLDVVELCPSEDKNEMTTSLMFHLLMCVLDQVHSHR